MTTATTTTQQVVIRCRSKNFVKKINVLTSNNVEFIGNYFTGKATLVQSYGYQGMNKTEICFSNKADAKNAVAMVETFIDRSEGNE